MEFKPQYISADDYKNYFGEDLASMFAPDDNPSNQVDSFLFRIENRLANYLKANYLHDINVYWNRFTENEKEQYKIALLEQAYYVIRNSDISSDSGYDVDEGIKANKSQLRELIIAPNCKDILLSLGLLSRQIRGNWYGSWWY